MSAMPDGDGTTVMPTRTLTQVLTEILPTPGPLGMLEQMEWAEQEIAAAARRHRRAADLLFHSRDLLRPTHDLMDREPVYRAYCRELLDRVAVGADTRPATAVELLLVASAASVAAPLDSIGVGLAVRWWQACGLGELTPDLAEVSGYYDALAGASIDAADTALRHRARRDARVLPAVIDCNAIHYGRMARCRFAPDRAAAGRADQQLIFAF
ncbi:hypothetical protein ACWDUL_38435 [Nocardia niigatensis]